MNKPYPRSDQGMIDQWITREVISNGNPYVEIEIRAHEGIKAFGEYSWLGRVSLNSSSLEFFPLKYVLWYRHLDYTLRIINFMWTH